METAIGRAIRELRKAKNLEPGQLAYKAGITKGAVSKIESGKTRQPKAETLAKIANALEVSVDDILLQAGLIPGTSTLDPLSAIEYELVATLRSITDPEERHILIQDIMGLVRFSARIDRKVRLLAEESEEYQEKRGEE